VPILAGVIAIAATLLVFLQTALILYDGVIAGSVTPPRIEEVPELLRAALYMPLICGLIVFGVAVALDLFDRDRRTIWSDCAFWLHVVSAPMLVHPLFILATGQDVAFGHIEPARNATVMLVLLILAFVYVALAIDRRSLLAPTLAYFGSLGIYYLVNSAANTTGIPPFSPREIVSELDRFIVGQNDAKRAVAIALRNRWRRQQLTGELREEVMPKNILMIGPTGVGKTEISRRLAKLAGAPFIKVEATKFTEVGYVGRDVEQIVRDLVEVGIGAGARAQARGRAGAAHLRRGAGARRAGRDGQPATRESFRKKLRAASWTTRKSRSRSQDTGSGGNADFDIPGMPGGNRHDQPIGDMLGKALGGKRTKRAR
jgi:hypothetical protein